MDARQKPPGPNICLRESKPAGSNTKPPFTRKKGSDDDRARQKRLRDKGKCFLCESADHIARNCPKMMNKKLPLSLNSMGLMSAAEIRLAALEEGTDLGLFGVAIPDWPLKSRDSAKVEHRLKHRDVLWRLSLAKLHEALPLPFDHLDNPIKDPFTLDRFSFREYGGYDTFLLIDKHDSS